MELAFGGVAGALERLHESKAYALVRGERAFNT
jgi:hypothetical protein